MNNVYLPEGRLFSTAQNGERLLSLDALERAMRNGTILEGRSTLCDNERNLYVELGKYTGIIPRSECVYIREGDIAKDIAILSRVGKPVCFKITDISADGNGDPIIMLSRRDAQLECAEKYIEALTAGDIIDAKVTHMENFGCFVDVGCGIISLLSIDAMSVSRISHPKDRFEVGQNIKVVVKTPADGGRITLTHKELLGTWEENASLYSVGQTAAGIVRSVESYGIFIELAPNLAGLAELKDDVKAGQQAAVYIKNIIPEKMKIKLVLIDSHNAEKHTCACKYFIDAPHIDYWRYSPDGCERTVETVFGQSL